MAGSGMFKLDRSLPSGDRHTTVLIEIHDIDSTDRVLSERRITLQHPDWSVEIGRGSKSDTTLIPHFFNGYFESRVMSRRHAVIRADQDKRFLTIEDVGSMHGTFLNGVKMSRGTPTTLLQDDIVTFGTEVVRGPETFSPLRLALTGVWRTDLESEKTIDLTTEKEKTECTNTFTADYSDEDNTTDDEIEIIEPPLIPQVYKQIDSSRKESFQVTSSSHHTTDLTSEETDHVDTHVSSSSHVTVKDPMLAATDLLSSNSNVKDVLVLETQTNAIPVDEHDAHVNDDIDLCSEDSSTHSSDEQIARPPSPSDAALVKGVGSTNATTYSNWQSYPSPPEPVQPALSFPYSLDSRTNQLPALTRPSLAPTDDLSRPKTSRKNADAVFGYPSSRNASSGYNWSSESFAPSNYNHPSLNADANDFIVPSWPLPSMCSESEMLALSANTFQPPTVSYPTEDRPRDHQPHLSTKSKSQKRTFEEHNNGRFSNAHRDSEKLIGTAELLSSVAAPAASSVSSAPLLPWRSELPTAALPEELKSPTTKRVKLNTTTTVTPPISLETETSQKGSSSKLKTAAKYTATAFAGIAVGAVGTVLGLASLPTDFFA